MMKKNKLISLALAVIGLVLVIGGIYLVISYLNYFGQGIIDFVSTNNVDTISKCGIVVPDMFLQLRDQFATEILPLLYLGFPFVVMVIAAIWFLSGYYFGKSRFEEDIESRERRKREIDEEVKKRLGKRKMQGEKAEEETEEEPEEEAKEEAPEEVEEEPVKRRKTKRR